MREIILTLKDARAKTFITSSPFLAKTSQHRQVEIQRKESTFLSGVLKGEQTHHCNASTFQSLNIHFTSFRLQNTFTVFPREKTKISFSYSIRDLWRKGLYIRFSCGSHSFKNCKGKLYEPPHPNYPPITGPDNAVNTCVQGRRDGATEATDSETTLGGWSTACSEAPLLWAGPHIHGSPPLGVLSFLYGTRLHLKWPLENGPSLRTLQNDWTQEKWKNFQWKISVINLRIPLKIFLNSSVNSSICFLGILYTNYS